jgi:hypothetical protein
MLFVITAGCANVALRAASRRLGMSYKEILISYCMMLAGAGIPAFGLTEYVIPTLAGAFYFQSPENNWAGSFFRHIPQCLVPVDLRSYGIEKSDLLTRLCYSAPEKLRPAHPLIIGRFYEGLPQEQRGSWAEILSRLPWGPWITPLLIWTAMAYALFFILICFSVVLRKQWVENERLTFPLVQIPLEIAGQEPRGLVPAFFRQKVMWIGFAIPMTLHCLNGLHVYFPIIPGVSLNREFTQLFRTRPWNQMGILGIWTHFSVIGFSFLLPLDLSFSLWFFFFIFKLQGIIYGAYGGDVKYVPNYPVPDYAAMQMLGAFLMLGAGMMWAARRHLSDVWRIALRGGPGDRASGSPQGAAGRFSPVEDRGEPLPYRTALFGMAAGSVTLALIWQAVGLNFFVGLVVVALFLVTALLLARFVSEGGLLFIQAPFRPTDIMSAAVGTGPLGMQNLTVLAYLERGLSMFDMRGFLLPFLMDIWKMSDAAGLNKRKLLGAIGLSIGIATLGSYMAVLAIGYGYGAATLEPWFTMRSPQQPFQVLKSYLDNPLKPDLAHLQLAAVGAAVAWALLAMRARFPAWPLHPIGYAMGPSWPMIQLWFSIMVGSLMKAAILRWGGMRLFRLSRPFFLGLVLGEFAAAALWIVVDSMTGVRGHRFFLF